MLVSVLDHDDSSIHHRPDRDSNAAKAHDVRAQAKQVHAQIGDQHAERQRDDRDQRAAYMQKKDNADECHDQAFLYQRALEGIDCAIDQVRAVIDRIDAHPLR